MIPSYFSKFPPSEKAVFFLRHDAVFEPDEIITTALALDLSAYFAPYEPY